MVMNMEEALKWVASSRDKALDVARRSHHLEEARAQPTSIVNSSTSALTFSLDFYFRDELSED